MPDAMSESELLVALKERFAAPEFALLPHVRNGTGFTSTTRTADALAMSTWPSRGLELHGFEIKSDRRDWLREKADPEKAEEICRYCDRWWVVVGSSDIIRDGELPPTWGLLVPKGKKLSIKVDAPKLEAQSITKQILAAILRKAQEAVVDESQIMAAVQAERKKHGEEMTAALQRAYDSGERKVAALKAKVDAFENTAGIEIASWNGGSIAEAVRFVLAGGVEGARRDLRLLRTQARRIADLLDAQLASAPDAEKEVA